MDGKSKLLDRLREQIRVRHYSIRTEAVYVTWVRNFIRFHTMRHPAEMGAPEVERFLSHLAVDRNVSASTQNTGRRASNLWLPRGSVGAIDKEAKPTEARPVEPRVRPRRVGCRA